LGRTASFEVADARELTPNAYDLVAMFDCLPDMGDPLRVARAVHAALREVGTLLLVEPFANDRLEENLNHIGRVSTALRDGMHAVAARMPESQFSPHHWQ
jgi:hypothetical protein